MTRISEVLAAGASWRFLSLLFRCPNSALVAAIKTLQEEIAPELRSEAHALVELLEDSNLEASYHVLLGSGGVISPYESDYQSVGEEGVRERGVILGDVAGFYRAFGFDPSKEMPEAPDHVSLEIAFVSHLKLKEAFALMQLENEPYQVCVAAEKKFLEEHLLTWLPQFLERIHEQDAHPFYKKAADIIKGYLLLNPQIVSPREEVLGKEES
ncbi:molecular chaperone TorD family protein [Candidatus Poribacteria bacterium]|nr:molecular chaperone TorD family protein [Candidatus Poribacteria bacterium]